MRRVIMRFDNDLRFVNKVMIITISVSLILQIINLVFLQNEMINIFMLGFVANHLVLSFSIFMYKHKKIKELQKELFDDLMLEIKKKK